MYRLHGFHTQNTMKTLYVLEELGVDYDFVFVDLMRGEQRTEAFLARNPAGKVPVLEHDGAFLFESGAICRYLANVEDSQLYPPGKLERGRVDQWLDFFTCHLGRNLTTEFFQRIIKPAAGLGDTDEAACAEARAFAEQQCALVDTHLQANSWLANDALSIADLFAFAYVEQCPALDFALDGYPRLQAWCGRLAERPAIERARARIAPYAKHP